MYCQACGTALSQQAKYCNRCGTQLTTSEAAAIESAEKRLDEYLDGLFWITVFGLGLILGGIVVMKAVHLAPGLIIAYMILSSLAFVTNFALSLWGVIRLTMSSRILKGNVSSSQPLVTSELAAGNAQTVLPPAPSVTENTTRALEPISTEHVTK